MKQKRTETIERIKEIYGWLSVAIDALAYVWRLNIFKGVWACFSKKTSRKYSTKIFNIFCGFFETLRMLTFFRTCDKQETFSKFTSTSEITPANMTEAYTVKDSTTTAATVVRI